MVEEGKRSPDDPRVGEAVVVEEVGGAGGDVRIDHTPSLETGSRGGSAALPVVVEAPIRTVNPLDAADGIEQSVQRIWHAALVRRGVVEDRWETWLAVRLRFVENGVEVQIPETLTWSDGRELTAETWVRSVEEYYLDLAIGGPWRGVLDPFGYEISWAATTATTIALTIDPFDEAAREHLMRALSVPPLPLHLLDPIRRQAGTRAVVDSGRLTPDDTREAPDRLDAYSWAFSGPFIPHGISEGRLLLDRNAAYGVADDAGNTLPYLDAVEVVPVRSPVEAFERFLDGELSLAELAPGFVAEGAPALRVRLENSGIRAEVVLGVNAPERLLYLGAGAPEFAEIERIEEALWGELSTKGDRPEERSNPADGGGSELEIDPDGDFLSESSGPGGASSFFLIPEAVQILEALAPLLAPAEFQIDPVAPELYLTRLFAPESRAAALVLVENPYPPRPTVPIDTGEPVNDFSELVRPRILVRRGLENAIPDRYARPLWIEALDRLFWRGGVAQ